MFDEARYTELKFAARGAFGSIYRAKVAVGAAMDGAPSVIAPSQQVQHVVLFCGATCWLGGRCASEQ